MGSACSGRSSIDVQHPGLLQIKSKSITPKEAQLKIRKSLIFHTEVSETTFLDLSTPKSGRSIKWRRGDLIGEGAYAKVYQCLNLKTGELLAVKNFIVSFI